MTISGIVVACRLEHLDQMIERLDTLPWAEVHHRDENGRVVITIEARNTVESAERLRMIQAIPHILMAELAGYYLDEE